MMYIPILIGFVAGALFWYLIMRPLQLNSHERERRSAGLPPKRRLPEDK